MTEPKTDGFEKRVTGAKNLNLPRGEWKLKKKQIERMESLTEEKSERMRFCDEGVERTDLWQRWRTRSDNVFFAKSKEKRGKVLVFIEGVHGRRSDTSIRDTSQSTNDTCRTPQMPLDSLSELCTHDDLILPKPSSIDPRHCPLEISNRHPIDDDTIHSAFTTVI